MEAVEGDTYVRVSLAIPSAKHYAARDMRKSMRRIPIITGPRERLPLRMTHLCIAMQRYLHYEGDSIESEVLGMEVSRQASPFQECYLPS